MDFYNQLTIELIRHQIRHGKPVYARKKISETESQINGTQLVITGFKAETGKPLMLEALGIKGSIWANDPETGEYKISETMIPEADLETFIVMFLDEP